MHAMRVGLVVVGHELSDVPDRLVLREELGAGTYQLLKLIHDFLAELGVGLLEVTLHVIERGLMEYFGLRLRGRIRVVQNLRKVALHVVFEVRALTGEDIYCLNILVLELFLELRAVALIFFRIEHVLIAQEEINVKVEDFIRLEQLLRYWEIHSVKASWLG